MISKIIRQFLWGNTLYIQIWENRLKVTDIKTGKVYDDEPLMALVPNEKGQLIVHAIGAGAKAAAQESNGKLINPFSHPRGLLADFQVAEKILQHAFKLIFENQWAAPAPKVVVHPMEKLEGGLTEIEVRAFRELALSAGAREIVIHTGQEQSVHAFDYEKLKAEDSSSSSVGTWK